MWALSHGNFMRRISLGLILRKPLRKLIKVFDAAGLATQDQRGAKYNASYRWPLPWPKREEISPSVLLLLYTLPHAASVGHKSSQGLCDFTGQ